MLFSQTINALNVPSKETVSHLQQWCPGDETCSSQKSTDSYVCDFIAISKNKALQLITIFNQSTYNRSQEDLTYHEVELDAMMSVHTESNQMIVPTSEST